MHSKIVYCAGVLGLAIVVFSPEGVLSECCHTSFSGLCENCAGPAFGKMYCGLGDCNVFGCNCDYGCLEGSCRKRRSLEDPDNGHDDADIKTANDVVRLADTDSDGTLNVTEVKLFLGRRGVLVEIDAFRALDVDGDGKLTAREIDSDVL